MSRMDDAFLELEQQLANITRVPSSNSSTLQNRGLNTPVPSSTSTKEVEQLKNQLKEEQQAKANAELKLAQLATAAKEERELNQKTIEELEARALGAEDRADTLEEKLLKVIELLKKERANKLNASPQQSPQQTANSANNQALEAAERRAAEAEDKIQQLSTENGRLEGSLDSLKLQLQEKEEKIKMQEQENEVIKSKILSLQKDLTSKGSEISQLNQQLNEEHKKQSELQEALNQTEGKQQELSQLIEHLKNVNQQQQSQFEQQLQQLKLQQQTSSSNSSIVSSPSSSELEDKLHEAEDRVVFLEDKLRKLVEIAKRDRTDKGALEQRIQDLTRQLSSSSTPPPAPDLSSFQATISDLEQQLRDLKRQLAETQNRAEVAEERVAQLQERLIHAEQRAAKAETLALDIPSETVDEMLEENFSAPPPPEAPSLEENFSAPPPPPPGAPPPPIFSSEAPKLKITKSETPSNRKLQPSPSAEDVVSQIKQGVQLRRVETVPDKKPPPAQTSGPQNFAFLAAEVSKNREKRKQQQQQKTTARKSVALTNLLNELESMKK